MITFLVRSERYLSLLEDDTIFLPLDEGFSFLIVNRLTRDN